MGAADKNVRTLWLDKSDHFLQVEPDRELLFAALGEFLTTCFTPEPG